MVRIDLVFAWGSKNVFFFVFFSKSFFAMCSMAENPVLIGKEQVEKIVPRFSKSLVTARLIDSPVLLRSCALATKIANTLEFVHRVLLKNFRISLLYVYSGKNIIILLPFITIFYQKLLKHVWSENTFSLAIMDFTRSS